MYTDTSHNSPATVYGNVYRAMLVVALKLQAYVQQWGIEPRRKVAFLYSTLKLADSSSSADRARDKQRSSSR